MTKKNQKTIEKRIEEIIGNNPASKIWIDDPRINIAGEIKSLLSDIIREIVGEDDEEHITYSGAFTVTADSKEELEQKIREWERGIGYNQAKWEIREKAQKLGLEM